MWCGRDLVEVVAENPRYYEVEIMWSGVGPILPSGSSVNPELWPYF